MRNTRSIKASLAILAGLSIVAVAPVVRADDDEKKKNKEDLDKAEKKQGKAGQQPGPGGVPGGGPAGGMLGEENPLKKILELMEQVEGRLYDSDTGDFTQTEQKKIVEAMKFEDKSHQALEELIKKIEEQMQQQQQQSQSGGGSKQPQQQKPDPNETEQQRQEREKREQEKREREKREEEQRRAQQQQQQQPQNQQQKPEDQEERARQQRREGQPPPPAADDAGRERHNAGRWGMLPAKLHQDAANAQNQEPPGKWADLINRYRERLANTKDE